MFAIDFMKHFGRLEGNLHGTSQSNGYKKVKENTAYYRKKNVREKYSNVFSN